MLDFQDPAAVFRAAVDAVNTEDWPAVVAAADPISLRVFRRQLLTGMSLEQLERELPGIQSAEAAHSLSPEEFLTHWLEGKSGHRRTEALIARSRFSGETADAVCGASPYRLDHVARGVVVSADRFAYVLYGPRQAPPAENAPWLAAYSAEERELVCELAAHGSPSVAMCRRQGDGSWRLIVDYEFLHWAHIAIAFTRREAEPPPGPDARAT